MIRTKLNLYTFLIIFLIFLSSTSLIASPESDFTKGLNLYNDEKYEQALEIFHTVISYYEQTGSTTNQRYVIARYYRAKCNFNLENLELSLNDFLFVDENNLPMHSVWKDIVDVYVGLNRENLAIRYLEEKIKSDKRFDFFFELARLYWHIDDRIKAIENFEKAKLIDPANEPLLFYMSYLYWEIEDPFSAGSTAQILQNIAFDPVIREYSKGMVDLSTGLYEDAQTHFTTVLDSDPRYSTMKTLLAESCIKAANLDKAEEIINELISDDMEEPYYWFLACEIPLVKRDITGAREVYDALDVRFKKEAPAVFLIAFHLVRTGSTGEAEDILTSNRDTHFQNVDFYPVLAALKYLVNKPEAIKELLLRFDENIDDEFPIEDALYWYLMFNESEEIFDELTSFAGLLGSDNATVDAAFSMAQFLIYTGDPGGSLPYLDRCLSIEPENPEYSFHATVVNLRLNNKAVAKTYWDKFRMISNKESVWSYIEVELKSQFDE